MSHDGCLGIRWNNANGFHPFGYSRHGTTGLALVVLFNRLTDSCMATHLKDIITAAATIAAAIADSTVAAAHLNVIETARVDLVVEPFAFERFRESLDG